MVTPLWFVLLSANGPDILWTKTYGGIADEQGYSVEQTSDGGYIICGATKANDLGDVYLIKTDPYGNSSWTKTYGGIQIDVAHSVQQTIDGGYIIAGYTNSYGAGKYDVYLIKTNSLGESLWTKTIGDIDNDKGYGLCQTSDSGYVVVGFTEPVPTGYRDSDSTNVYLVKTDANGGVVWTKEYGGRAGDWGCSVEQTSDGGYIIAGYTNSFSASAGDNDIYLIKTDSLGDSLWTKVFCQSEDDRAYSVHQTIDGGYVITGGVDLADTANLYLLKTNASGNQNWFMMYEPLAVLQKDDIGFSVVQTPDQGYIVAGVRDNEVCMVKTNASGDTLWRKVCGGVNDDWGYAVQLTLDGGYIIAGYTNSFGAGGDDVYLIKTEPIITMTSPIYGDIWQGASNHTIQWTCENVPANIYRYRIVFSAIGDSVYPDTIAKNLSASSQSFNWSVPSINSAHCYIKVQLVDSSASIMSEAKNDSEFTIDSDAPLIDSTTVWNDTSSNGPFEIITKVIDALSWVDSVFLYFRRNEDPDWICSPMHRIGFTFWYRDSIPAVTLSYDTVRYYIMATDVAFPENIATSPPDAPSNYYWFIADPFGIEENRAQPEIFSFAVGSNPVRGRAVFYLQLPNEEMVDLRIYDVLGRLIANPLHGCRAPGYYEIPWNIDCSSGVYFYSFVSGRQQKNDKFVFVR